MRKNLTLSFGVRHEVQNHVPGRLNIAPRFGFVWSPKKDGSITFRGGAGIFYDWFAAQVYEQTLRVNGERQRDLVIINPGFLDPFSAGAPPSISAPGTKKYRFELYVQAFNLLNRANLGAFSGVQTSHSLARPRQLNRLAGWK